VKSVIYPTATTPVRDTAVVRPYAQGFRSQHAEAWLAARTPWWLARIALAAAWVVTMTVSILIFVFSDLDCSPDDPTICGPDPADALVSALVVLVPVLLVWMPLAGCALGLVVSVLGVLFDPVSASRLVWAVLGALCAAVGARLLRSRSRQLAVQEQAARGGTASIARDWRSSLVLLPIAAAGVCLVVGAVLTGVYVTRVSAEDVHVARAIEGYATVSEADDLEITLRLPSREAVTLEPYDTSPYPAGTEVPVLLDPQDAGWVRLQAEPADFTLWLLGAALLFGLACPLVWRGVGPLRLAHREWPAVQVGVRTSGTAQLLAPDGDPQARHFAWFPAEARRRHPTSSRPSGRHRHGNRSPDPAEPSGPAEPFGHAARTPLVTATLVGRLCEGSFVALILDGPEPIVVMPAGVVSGPSGPTSPA